ncbi:MAG: hypothetical protein LBN05_06325 [Oscillospiraceae bacterium]|jgi:hypothetical protein|nr:hypothetical protein [Oscillospiraceae bacterium]
MPTAVAEEQVTLTPPPSLEIAPAKNHAVLYSVLSYIGPLWLIGLFAEPEKHRRSVRFHVGQGIMLTIAQALVWLVVGLGGGLLGRAIGALTGVSFADGFAANPADFLFAPIYAVVLMLVFSVLEIILAVHHIQGIVHAAKGIEKPLGIVGKRAFYK